MRLVQACAVFVVVGLLAPGLAEAQEADSKLWIGAGVGLSPAGTLKVKVANEEQSADTVTGYQINGLIDIRVAPHVSIGFAPGILFNIKSSGDTTSATELDLPVRLTLDSVVAPKIRMYGFVSPGYTILFPPSDGDGNNVLGHPSGFMVGFGGGIGIRVAPKVIVTGELGYQFRFASNTVQNVDFSIDVNYLTLALGLVVAVD